MKSVMDTVGDVMTGRSAIREVKKKLEKACIKSVYAPLKKMKCNSIRDKHDKQITQVAEEAISATEAIVKQLDTSIRGKGRKALESTINKHKEDYNHL